MKRLFLFLAGTCLLPVFGLGQSIKTANSLPENASGPHFPITSKSGQTYIAYPKESGLQPIQRISRPGKNMANTATITLDVQYDCGENNGYQLLLDADATAYGIQIPAFGDITYSGDAADGLYDVFEYKIPTDATGIIAEQKWLSFNESASIEIAPGTYDFVITHPDENYGIQVAYGDTREDDFVFEAGIEYIFTIFPDSWGEICILTRQASTDLALIDLLSPQSCDTLSGNENLQCRQRHRLVLHGRLHARRADCRRKIRTETSPERQHDLHLPAKGRLFRNRETSGHCLCQSRRRPVPGQ